MAASPATDNAPAPAQTAKAPKQSGTGARLRALYNDKLAKELQKDLGLKNLHEVPRLEKIVVNAGLGRAKDDKKLMESAANTLRKSNRAAAHPDRGQEFHRRIQTARGQ